MKIILQFIFIALLFLFFPSCKEKEKGLIPEGPPYAYVTQVFDYHYAPGQHAHLAKTPDWINGKFSSVDIYLGGWGGYVVLGFDHDVYNTEGYNLVIFCGNSAAPEPGIIYLMDDTNGNGLPDDEWFEVKGSEINHPDYIRNYKLTYYRPKNAGDNVTWRDKFGNTGELPKSSRWWWKEDADSVTFTGTRLPDAYYNRASEGSPEYWVVHPHLFKYGYAENGRGAGRDTVAIDYCEKLRGNLIDISDAIDKDGNPAQLKKIRFIKIQTGVFQQAGWLGEISTEINGVGDLSLLKID
jgi:hypothetical protein